MQKRQLQKYPINALIEISDSGDVPLFKEADLENLKDSFSLLPAFEYLLSCTLKERNQTIFHMYYKELLTLQEIAMCFR